MPKHKTGSLLTFILFVIIVFKLNTIHAQIENNGDIFISDNNLFYVGADTFNFGITGSTTTSRTPFDYGVLSFSKEASTTGASNMHFVDGYAQTQSDKAFILPIGQSGIYAPIQVTPSSCGGVDAAYYRSAPNAFGHTLDTSISSISTVEYWDIKSTGVHSSISLSWRPSSAISDLTSYSLPDLTIIGWNGYTWTAIPSVVDEYSILGAVSSLLSGSISSNAELDLSAYSAFSLGSTNKQLLVHEIDPLQLLVYINNNRLFIKASQPLETLIVYDILGKRLISENLNRDFEYNIPFNYEHSVYIVKIKVNNSTSFITKKIIHKN